MNLMDYPKEIKAINYHATGIYTKLPSQVKTHVDYQDLIQAGYIGLWDAIKKYVEDRNCKFSTYANGKIRWAMRDIIRRYNVIPTNTKQAWYYDLKFMSMREEDEPIEELDTDKIDLINLIGRLKDRDRRIFNRYLDGYTGCENSKLEGISKSCVYMVIYNVKNRLKEEIVAGYKSTIQFSRF